MKRNRATKPSEPSHRRTMNVNRKLRTRVDKSNITTKRVTMLPGFLSHGIKSKTVNKSSIITDYDEISSEDGPLSDSPPAVRRSNRLSKKNQDTTASSYFLEVIGDHGLQAPCRNRSKSIFKEIKEKYKKLEGTYVNQDFGARLLQNLSKSFSLNDSTYYKKEICREVALINGILSGKLDPVTMSGSKNRKRSYHEDDKENFPIKFPHLPQNKWVFQTPPNRKLNYNNVKVEDNYIRPAVIQKCNEGKVLYEMKTNINVDFSKYTTKQEVDIDKRYMIETTDQSLGEQSENKFQFPQSDSYELENHFLSLTCRPKKVPTTVSRIAGFKRKRDIFEPEAGCSTEMEDLNEFDSNFTFLNNLTSLEESFTFKFTAEYPEGSMTGHLFDFDGNKKDTFNFRY